MNISEFEFDRPTSAAQAIERAASILRSIGVDPHQIGIWLLRQHGKFDATHFNVYEDACEIIEWRMTQSQPSDLTQTPATVAPTTLTATEIGQMLAERFPDIVHRSPQQINQLLKQLNFQVRDSKKIWHLTKLGQQYGQVIRVTDEQERTRLQIRWSPSVIDQLLRLFDNNLI